MVLDEASLNKKRRKGHIKKVEFPLNYKSLFEFTPRYFGLNQKYSPTSNMRGNREDEYQRSFLCPTQQIKERKISYILPPMEPIKYSKISGNVE